MFFESVSYILQFSGLHIYMYRCPRFPHCGGRLSAALALRHPYFLLGGDQAAAVLSKLSLTLQMLASLSLIQCTIKLGNRLFLNHKPNS
ncbi:unnamed protein product, partial [Vitis vinifera]